MTRQKVQVFAIGPPRAGATRDQRRWYVRWRVDGRDRTRSFKAKAEAERFRTQLQYHASEGTTFEPETGEPVAWALAKRTWWEWSREFLTLKWPQWSGNTRRTAVEAVAMLTPLLVRKGAVPPDGLQVWLRSTGCLPLEQLDLDDPMVRWLDRWSIPLNEITPPVLERALTLATTRKDGRPMAVSVIRRLRMQLNAILQAAVRRELLVSNPMLRVEWKAPERTIEVDVATVPSPGEVAEVIDYVERLPTSGAKYAALFACIGLAGMRPSEAIGLNRADLDLPAEGWGLARLRRATATPGRRFTLTGEMHEDKALKHRANGAVREVPLPEPLVALLQRHLVKYPPVGGRVFSTDRGAPINPTAYEEVWRRARAVLWPGDHHLANVRAYDLRHSAATMMLRAGVMPAEVARRLGHSVDVLTRVYAGVVDGERERSNAMIDEVLRTGSPGRT